MKIKDTKIKSMLETFTHAKYYDTTITLWEERFDGLIENLNQRIKSLKVLSFENKTFLIDTEMLSKEINLDCMNCGKYNKYGCCSGKPHKISQKNKSFLEEHIDGVLDTIRENDEDRYRALLCNGGFLAKVGAINEYNKICSFLLNDNGWYKCAIHKYALENDLDKYDICPLSCLMFPLEIIEFKNDRNTVYYITSVADAEFWTRFGRWANYEEYYKGFTVKCLYKDKHEKKIFKEKDYKPVYVVNKSLLIHEFGSKLYKELERCVEGKNG